MDQTEGWCVQAARDWFVVATQARKEVLAHRQLSNQGFQSFLPLRNKTIRHARRFVNVQAPLFPGYLCLTFNPEPRSIRSINGTLGVRALLTSGEVPLRLPHGFVETLAAHLCEDGTVTMQASLRQGDRIEIASGPFARQIGEILKMDDKGRVQVLLNALSEEVRVHTNIRNLLPA